MPEADVVYACDAPWWKRNLSAVRESCSGELWTQDISAAREYGLQWVRGVSKDGLCTSADDGIYHGSNSGYQAIGLSYLWGAERVLLLGYDCQYADGKRHWFGDHPKGLNNATGTDAWRRHFERIAEDCKKVGFDVVNCSRSTAIKGFRRSTIEAELCGLS